MRDDIDKILDECIDRMNAGESLDNCLASYPEYSKELRPLLTAASGIRDACSPVPGPGAKALGRRKLQAALAEKRMEGGIMRRIFDALSFERTKLFAAVSVMLVAVIVGLSVASVMNNNNGGTGNLTFSSSWAGMKKFTNVSDFETYVTVSQEAYASGYWGGGTFAVRKESTTNIIFSQALDSSATGGAGGGGAAVPMPSPERFSDTNVQVAGIDEPDVIKTDGQQIYFSPEMYYYYRDSFAADKMMPPQMTSVVKVINSFPAENLSLASNISDKNGDLLLYNDTLIIFSNSVIYGYDVSNPQSPVSEWEMKLEDNTYVTAARLYDGKIYLVTRTWIDTVEPYYTPLTVGGVALKIEATSIYHPVVPVSVDATYTALVCDPLTGNVESTVSFVGSYDSSVIYMSENGIYVTYSYNENVCKFYFDFYKVECADIFPASVTDKLTALEGYDISDTAKLTELGILTEKYLNSLGSGERAEARNEISNRLSKYYDNHKRELIKTGIVKIGLEGFDIAATGAVPGTPLNQFSIDEYKGNLRIATTVEGNFGMFWGMGGTSANDVYVLDSGLKIVGSIQGLGLTEKIYSARFIGDKGYLVTFRQTDPFYVLDLSDPQNPELKGELKIPGYSAYLHPISETRILGIGQENWKVKISLFDVADAANPAELDKYLMSDSWSDILNTHHAFLLDSKHKIFFLPGSNGGYVFSYAGDELELVKAVGDIQARRAIYINDYLYIVGDNKVVVLDETDWTTVSELKF